MTAPRDACGPEASAIIGELVPDELAGVNVAPCCADHDDDYKAGGGPWARLRADWRLARCIRCKLRAAGRPVAGAIGAGLYLLGVRLGGVFCFNWQTLNPWK
jgi:hypothetical protein